MYYAAVWHLARVGIVTPDVVRLGATCNVYPRPTCPKYRILLSTLRLGAATPGTCFTALRPTSCQTLSAVEIDVCLDAAN